MCSAFVWLAILSISPWANVSFDVFELSFDGYPVVS